MLARAKAVELVLDTQRGSECSELLHRLANGLITDIGNLRVIRPAA